MLWADTTSASFADTDETVILGEENCKECLIKNRLLNAIAVTYNNKSSYRDKTLTLIRKTDQEVLRKVLKKYRPTKPSTL